MGSKWLVSRRPVGTMIPGRQTHCSRGWVVQLVAALVALLATILSSAPPSAVANAGTETRVRASASVVEVLVAPPPQEIAGHRLGNDAAGAGIVVATGVAAKSADEVAEGVSRSPSFIVKPNGETVIVPKGAQGPFPVESGKGFMFRGGSGGHGLSDAASDVRIMDPVTGGKYPKPNGYASYLNGGGQTINPFTGQTVGKSSPWWHWEFLP